MSGGRYYFVRAEHGSRWAVCRPVPGMPGSGTPVEDCPTQQAAERACDHWEASRARQLMHERHEAMLLGSRP